MRSRRNTKANLSILLQYYGREERDQSVSMLCTFNLKRSSKLVPCYFVLHITPGPAAPSYKSNQTPTWFHTTEGGFFPSCKVDICLFINFPKHPLLKLLIFLWCKIVPAKFWELSQILPKLADWAVHGWSSRLAALGAGIFKQAGIILHTSVHVFVSFSVSLLAKVFNAAVAAKSRSDGGWANVKSLLRCLKAFFSLDSIGRQ